MTTLTQAFEQVEAATTPRELFNGDKDLAAKTYRDLAKVLHPDKVPATKKAQANAAFAKLANMYVSYTSDDADRLFTSITMATRKRAYVVGERFANGDIAGIYRAEYREDDETKSAAVKMPRSPVNNDLIENEARVLQHLADTADPLGLPYFSQLLDTFRYRDAASGTDRQVNVLTLLDGWYSLIEVKRAYPDGLDVRDAAWMWKRLLIAIGHAHRAGVVHGAVLHQHVMIHPEQHGLALVDWSYAVIENSAPVKDPTRCPKCWHLHLDYDDEPCVSCGCTFTASGPALAGFGSLKAVVPQFKGFYPPEVFDKAPVDSTTDIYMASQTMNWLLNAETPQAFRAFIRGCALKSPSQRPQDAWQVLKELDELLLNNVGPRRFRPFSMPSRGGA